MRTRSYCVTGARERWLARTVARRQPFFLCVRCFHFRHFDRASLIWRRSRTDVPRTGRCDYPVIVVLRIVFVVTILYLVKWLWCSANMFDSNILLNFYNEIANRSALQLARWDIIVCLLLIRVVLLRVNRCVVRRDDWHNLVSNERTARLLIRLSPSPRSLARRG